MEDDECLRIMGNAFEKLRAGFIMVMYWGDLDETGERLEKDMAVVNTQQLDANCTVM